MSSLVAMHAQALLSSVGRVWRSPIATLLTAAGIGIILSLPIGLLSLTLNVQAVVEMWESQPQISLFLKKSASEQDAMSLRDQLEKQSDIADAQLLLSDGALEEFKQTTGLESILEYIPENPLPSVIVVQPAELFQTPEAIQNLVNKLRNFELVDTMHLDLEWMQRIYTFFELAQILFGFVSAVLILAAVLLIGNTTRMAVANRADEITVINDIGGTRTFIRRPFLYSGVIHGLLGIGVAWILITIATAVLEKPVDKLALLYSSEFEILPIPWSAWLVMVVSTVLLSWAASRIAVDMHLHRLTSKIS